MTDTLTGTAPSATAAPSRKVLIGLAVVILIAFVGLMAGSANLSSDSSTKDITAAFDYSSGQSQILSYAGMALCGIVLLFGAALRGAFRPGDTWLANAVMLGAAGFAATLASWVVTDAAIWKAVDLGDQGQMHTFATLSDVSFLPLMGSLLALYIGAGAAGLVTGVLPKWLAVLSIVLGAIAVLGPLGFIPFLLLPLWGVAVASLIRLEP